FAATDYIITKTLSTADAAEHLVHNPIWGDLPSVAQNQTLITSCLLVLLGAVFMRGFREAIWLAVVLVAIYLALNVLVIGSGLFYLCRHPYLFVNWWDAVQQGNWHIDHPPVH